MCHAVVFDSRCAPDAQLMQNDFFFLLKFNSKALYAEGFRRLEMAAVKKKKNLMLRLLRTLVALNLEILGWMFNISSRFQLNILGVKQRKTAAAAETKAKKKKICQAGAATVCFRLEAKIRVKRQGRH